MGGRPTLVPFDNNGFSTAPCWSVRSPQPMNLAEVDGEVCLVDQHGQLPIHTAEVLLSEAAGEEHLWSGTGWCGG
ncbi:hypothetical protein S1361_00615 [Streptomyces cyanogenus]|uniref:Uncharacterized protein n=1 Tax=Streptomyces cyanogenus TaxID=80860 RepID=A0ABX7TK21_STRCY|nr:hypothetical protein S1361_00615 [Streptomyces cyanogenus]